MDELIELIQTGDKKLAVAKVKTLLETGKKPHEIVTKHIEPAMESLNDKCTAENFNLLEVMLAGRAVMSVMQVLFPVESVRPSTKGTVVLATLEGDVHDLGKNILKTILTINGYRVIDCGKDCPLERLITTAETEQPFAIGLSGLITSVIPLVQKLKGLLLENNLHHIKVFAGGAALKQASADLLNVDFLAKDAFAGETYLNSIQSGDQ